MSFDKSSIKVARLPEIAFIYNENSHEWETAYRKDFKRQRTITPINAILFDDTAETFTSEIFAVSPYSTGLLLINLDVTSAPTDIYFNIEFSDDMINWFKYMIGPFGDLRYEDAAGDKKECLDFPILAPYLRVYAVSSNCDASNTFLITAKIILNG